MGVTENYKNPLLEEYVDELHFVLELWLEIGIEKVDYKGLKHADISAQFLNIYFLVTELQELRNQYALTLLTQYYLGLGIMLGFTWEQIEQAYFEKNKVNHERQENGY